MDVAAEAAVAGGRCAALKPLTLHPAPDTHTPHSTLYTLHPTPYTLHPRP
eukprot:CAMPEP_0182857862 /NCGR_PEP_ID=MMETSP0034_2-20130328/3293_1 /TAXON_ID=156128 /ORGANISM="Nephroselmis pyriformis, Strain CCMP717" /LENGTH=49 /DNA_ID=CAMNT_0024989157 /DNA_START=171 /DNA_END=320 /DNA_ORIENTATION=-